MAVVLKDPADVLDYTRTWTRELAAVVDTIATSSWSTDDGITIDSDTNDDTTATVWLSGGTAGEEYAAVNTITTTAGRTYAKRITIKVERRW